MKIGMTYDLRSEYLKMGYSLDETAEFDRDDTVDAIENVLADLGHEPTRIGNAKRLIDRLSNGDRWDLVFNIAEGLHGVGREAQVPAILEVFDIPYTFSDPMVMSLTLHKAMTKRIIRDAGLATTDFYLLESAEDAGNIHFDPPWFIKPVSEGTGKGVSPHSIIRRRKDLENPVLELLSRYGQPVLVEPYLPGREFTMGIVGTGKEAAVLGTMEVHLLSGADQGVYSYTNKENSEELVRYSFLKPEDDPTVKKAEALCLSAWRILGCRDAGRIDIRCDANGNPMFMEVNPMAGLHPEHSDLPIICGLIGMPYVRLMEIIVISAAARCKPFSDALK
jgi:D-alanine-D-alanine ligase